MEIELKTGNIYYIETYTAPKYYNGYYFECLLTDQKISGNAKAIEDLGNIKDWKTKIYKPERFHKK